jgi:hypothetical protein
MVLVCSYRRRSLWRPPDFYAARCRSNRRRLGRLCRRSDGRVVDLALPCVPLVHQPLESKIDGGRNFLFGPHRRLRRCRYDRVLSPLSKRWAALCRSNHSCRWRGHDGRRWDSVFSRTRFLAAIDWNYLGDNRAILVAPLSTTRKFTRPAAHRASGTRVMRAGLFRPGRESRRSR